MRSMTLAKAALFVASVTGQEIAPVSLRAACLRGALKAHKEGRNWKVTADDLMTYLKNRPDHWQPDARINVTDDYGTRQTIWYHL